MRLTISLPKTQIRKTMAAAIAEYSKRLSRFCNLSLNYGSDIYTVLSCTTENISSTELAQIIERMRVGSVSDLRVMLYAQDQPVVFTVNEKTYLLSTAGLPFDVQVVIILEQIYRAFKIIHGETYHK